MDFEKIKFTIAKIQFENLQLNADKTAIEANQSTHKIAEWIHDNFVPLGAEVIVELEDDIGSWKEDMNYEIQHAIEQQEQEYREDYFLGREEGIKYAIKMHDMHFSKFPT